MMNRIAKQKDENGKFAKIGMQKTLADKWQVDTHSECVEYTVDTFLECVDTMSFEEYIKTVEIYKEEDDYDLDEFLKLLKLLPKKSDENIIKEFKERFKKDYDETSEALEWHIETLVNFGGDSTHKIYKAMIEVINDILNDVPSTDKDGMIEYLQEMI